MQNPRTAKETDMTRLFPLATIVLLASVGAAAADCTHRLTLRNLGSGAVSVAPAQVEIRVRRGGEWSGWQSVPRGGWFDDRNRLNIAAGESASDGWRTSAACSDTVQLRGSYSCLAGPRTGSSFSWGENNCCVVRDVIPIGQRC
jgi:hypothetical protein